MKKGLIITMIILAAIGAGFALYYFFWKKPASSAPAPGSKEDTKSSPAAQPSVKPDKVDTAGVKPAMMPQTAVDNIPETPFVTVRTDLNNAAATEVEIATDPTEIKAGFGRG